MVEYLLVSLIIAWLILLTFFVFKSRRHYLNLTTRTKNYTIDDILDTLVKDDTDLKAEVQKIGAEVEKIIKASNSYFQKLGIVRFDPYGKHGGGHESFVMSLLDRENNGILINFIYTPDGVRVYAKKVKGGQGEEFQLSAEEKQAIEKSS